MKSFSFALALITLLNAHVSLAADTKSGTETPQEETESSPQTDKNQQTH